MRLNMTKKLIAAKIILIIMSFTYLFGAVWFGGLNYSQTIVLVCGFLLAILNPNSSSMLKFTIIVILSGGVLLGVAMRVYEYYLTGPFPGLTNPAYIHLPYYIAVGLVLFEAMKGSKSEKKVEPHNKSLKEVDALKRAP